ncbi:MAG: methionine gamma-lyase family protein [Bacillota bacterium]
MLDVLLRDENIPEQLKKICSEVIECIKTYEEKVADVCTANFLRVQRCYQERRLHTGHFHTSDGYGYHDSGRDKLEECLAIILGAERAFFRQQIVSGTHAIALALKACLKPGDVLIYATGRPYETLAPLFNPGQPGSLPEAGIVCKTIPLDAKNCIDEMLLLNSICRKTRMVAFQRSSGYQPRPAFTLDYLAPIFAKIKARNKDIIIFVDNCYGEFVEQNEPTTQGADLIAGSFLKNPGGGLTPCGGYLAGNKGLIELIEAAFFAPGLSGIGPSLISNRHFFQALYLAPLFVRETLQGLIFFACLFSRLGYDVFPAYHEKRSDIIQGIILNAEPELLRFCRLVQKNSPVDSFVFPVPAPMPGYRDEVIMAGGTFISGSSAEFSADAPMTPPYTAYLQGGYYKEQIILAGIKLAMEFGKKK